MGMICRVLCRSWVRFLNQELCLIFKYIRSDLEAECFLYFDTLLNINHKSHANMSFFGREVTLHLTF